MKRKWPGRPEADRSAFCQRWGLRLCSLARVADDYLQRAHRLRGFAAEAGASGECFFLSVAASLETLRAQLDELPSPLEALFAARASRTSIARRLRGMVGAGILEWPPRRFVDFLTTCLAAEVAGTWLDRWRVSELIAGTRFAFVRSVNEVAELTVDHASTVTLRCKDGDSPETSRHRLPSGLEALASIQKAVADRVSEAGNGHWATNFDVEILARELKICFCILGDQATSMSREDDPAPADVLHAYAATPEDAEVYVCLYNISFQHFQLAVFDLESGFQSSFLPTEVPVSLRDALHRKRLS